MKANELRIARVQKSAEEIAVAGVRCFRMAASFSPQTQAVCFQHIVALSVNRVGGVLASGV